MTDDKQDKTGERQLFHITMTNGRAVIDLPYPLTLRDQERLRAVFDLASMTDDGRHVDAFELASAGGSKDAISSMLTASALRDDYPAIEDDR